MEKDRRFGKIKHGRMIYIIAAVIVVAVVVVIAAITMNIRNVTEYFDDTAYKNMSSYAKQCASSIGEMKMAYAGLCKTISVEDGWESDHTETLADMKNIMKGYDVFYLSFIGRDGSGFDYRDNRVTRKDLPFDSDEIPSLKKQFETNAYIGNTGRYEYAIQYPVTSGGRFIGDIYIGLSVTAQFNYLPDSNYSVFVVEKDTGKIIGNSGSAYLLGTTNTSIYKMVNNVKDKSSGFSRAEKKTNVMIDSLMAKGKTAIMSVRNSSPKQICCLTPSSNTWYVCVKAKLSDINGDRENIFGMLYRLIALFAFLALLIMCIVIYYQRRMSQMSRENEKRLEAANNELNRALVEANRANAAKTIFLSNMSHDIRTPMNAIVGMNQLAFENIDDTNKVKECLKVIRSSSDHLLKLINDVLEVSKIEKGKMVLMNDLEELPVVISNVNEMIRQLCNMKNQQYDFNVEPLRHEFVLGDELRLRQVLINVLNNACKFTPEKGHISFTVRELEDRCRDGRTWIRYIITDDGIGMGEEVRQNLFEPFVREKDSVADKIEGTGLGLTIVKSLVSSKGGTIEVESRRGEGTTFTIDMPYEIASKEDVEERYPNITSASILFIGRKRREFDVTAALDELGISWKYAGSLDELEGEAAADSCTAVVADNDAEGFGCGYVRTIRKKAGSKALILISGSTLQEDALSGAADALMDEYGADGFIARPIAACMILESIKNAHKDSGGADGPADLAGRIILLVEDNRVNAAIAQQILEGKGCRVEIAEDGRQAVDKFANADDGYYDCILMDIQMPVMNGYEATRAIRSLDRKDAGRVPIIAMTANAFAEDVKAAIESGMNAHIAKPIDIEELLSKISSEIRNAGE